MLKKLNERPLTAALLIVIFYGLWFIVPMFVNGIDPDAKGINGIDGLLSVWSSEVVTAAVFALIVTLLGWWEQIGFCRIEKGGLKFLLPIFLLAMLILNFAWVLDESGKWLLCFDSPLQFLAFLGVILLLGFVEEGVFRGALFYGLSTRFSPLVTVVLTAMVFGLFHFVNLIDGAPFSQTLYQAIHAGAMGFLYASLRLRLGAVWPLMLIHGFWDFSLFILQSVQSIEKSGDISVTLGLGISVPALFYGIFVYWRWSKSHTKHTL